MTALYIYPSYEIVVFGELYWVWTLTLNGQTFNYSNLAQLLAQSWSESGLLYTHELTTGKENRTPVSSFADSATCVLSIHLASSTVMKRHQGTKMTAKKTYKKKVESRQNSKNQLSSPENCLFNCQKF